MSGFDTDYRDETVCPWCGYEHDCSHEFFEGNQDHVEGCYYDSCGKLFDCAMDFTVTYTTKKHEESQ